MTMSANFQTKNVSTDSNLLRDGDQQALTRLNWTIACIILQRCYQGRRDIKPLTPHTGYIIRDTQPSVWLIATAASISGVCIIQCECAEEMLCFACTNFIPRKPLLSLSCSFFGVKITGRMLQKGCCKFRNLHTGSTHQLMGDNGYTDAWRLKWLPMYRSATLTPEAAMSMLMHKCCWICTRLLGSCHVLRAAVSHHFCQLILCASGVLQSSGSTTAFAASCTSDFDAKKKSKTTSRGLREV
jgi:hypothetical protein